MSKANLVIIIVIMVIVGIILFLILKINKTMYLQNNLILGMATKMGVENKEEVEPELEYRFDKDMEESESELKEETEEETKEILRISDKIFQEEKLTKQEKGFYNKFSAQVDEEVNLLKSEQPKEENKLNWKDKKDVEEYEEYTTGQEAEQESNKKRLSFEEKEEIMMSLFDDGFPKYMSVIVDVFAKKSGLKKSMGNTHKVLKSLSDKKMLHSYELVEGKKRKLFYGLPTWFNAGKLKKEFEDKINQ